MGSAAWMGNMGNGYAHGKPEMDKGSEGASSGFFWHYSEEVAHL
jgi:hypothetical protein